MHGTLAYKKGRCVLIADVNGDIPKLVIVAQGLLQRSGAIIARHLCGMQVSQLQPYVSVGPLRLTDEDKYCQDRVRIR